MIVLFLSYILVLHNVLHLHEGGDFEALQYQLSTNFGISKKLHLTTEPPLLGSAVIGRFSIHKS